MKALFLVLLFSSTTVLANNYFIPNHYKGRRELNNFTATAWSERREINGYLQTANEETSEGSTKTEESKAKDLNARIYHRSTELPLTIEAGINILQAEVDDIANAEDIDRSANLINVSGGYELKDLNMAVAASAVRARYESDYSPSNDSTSTNVNFVTLGWGYKLENQIYLGLGYLNTHVDYEETGYTYQDTSHAYLAGIGKVFGDSKNPTGTAETYLQYKSEDMETDLNLTIRGLYNISEPTQLYGSIILGKIDYRDGSDDESSEELELGLDHEFGSFYIAPEISFYNLKGTSDTADTNYSFEVGYRAEQMEVGLIYNTRESKETYDTPPNDKTETKTLQLNFAYFY